MRDRLVVSLLLAAALPGCGGQHAPAPDHHLPPALATPPDDASLLRISRTGGAQLLRASTLASREWVIPSGLPPMSRLLGAGGSDDQTVYGADNGGRLVAIDLKEQRVRLVAGTARQLVAGPDGAILGIDSAHHAVRFSAGSPVVLKASVEKGAMLLRGPGDQVLAVGNRPGTLQVLGAAGEVRHLPIPAGRVTATWVGDLVAVTTDSGVVFVDPSGKPVPKKSPPRFVKIRGTPTVSAFSPSGHRLYVARKVGGLAMLDRFTRAYMKDLPLPGTVDGLRADRTGKWLLAHAGSGDSLWVIDLVRWTVAWRGVAPWADDLPQVVGGQTLLIRRKADVAAIDLSGGTPPERGVLAGGAADLFIMLPWTVKSQGPSAAEIAAASSTTALSPAMSASAPPADTTAPKVAADQRSSPPATAAPPPPAAAAGTLYVQVSSSQNQEWAQALAKQLKEGGFPASVLEPKTSDESYRVVVGPYQTREDADAVGKRLGRSYFIITPGSGDT